MQVGEIFNWKDFPYQYNGDIKSRYFIYMGKTHFSVEPAVAYLYTTTGRLGYYQEGRERSGNSYLLFKSGEYCFKNDCILDFDIGLHEVGLSVIEANSDIEILDRLEEKKIAEIYNHIRESGIAKITKIDIHSSLNLGGITGLRKP